MLIEKLANLEDATVDLEYSHALLDTAEAVLMEPVMRVDQDLLAVLRAAVSNVGDRVCAMREAVDAVTAAHRSTSGPSARHVGA